MVRTLLLAGAAIAPFPAFAQTPAPAPQSDEYHARESEAVIVTGVIRRDVDRSLSGTTVVTGEELDRERRTTIGETLARQPGVSATSFGPNSSRPVLRGFQGERIRVLQDGIGSFDVSNTSVDHAVAVNPLLADRVEVLRGPQALLYGSSAIGGVVNILDGRIPRRLPDERVHLDALATYGTAGNERAGAATADVPLGGGFVLHADGSYAKSDDLDTGGFILSRALRRQAAASAETEIRELADLRGALPNSAARTWEVAGGAAYVGSTGNFGLSASRFDTLYGVPIRFSLDPAVEAEEVRLDARQTRVDARGEVLLGTGVLETIRMRLGYADYQHQEIEDTGEIASTFLNDAGEGRIEFVQRARDGWRGAFGGQALIRDFEVRGEEKYLPRNRTRQFGLFTVQEVEVGPARLEAGVRYERTRVRADADEDLGNPALRRSFDAFSGSIGGSVGLNDTFRIGANVSRTERAPAAEELFANGPHLGTAAFEIGDAGLRKEASWSGEAALRGRGAGYSFALTGYYSRFDDFIFLAPTGEVEDDLAVFEYLQGEADVYGFEAEARVTLARLGGFELSADGVADYTRATIDGFGPAPRIPPLRLLGALEAGSDRLDVRAEVERVFAQRRNAPVETETGGYTMVNASIALRPFPNARQTSLLLSANNLLDVTARRHASFLKDYAPLAGRDIRATVHVAF